jgi:hypothetical protein
MYLYLPANWATGTMNLINIATGATCKFIANPLGATFRLWDKRTWTTSIGCHKRIVPIHNVHVIRVAATHTRKRFVTHAWTTWAGSTATQWYWTVGLQTRGSHSCIPTRHVPHATIVLMQNFFVGYQWHYDSRVITTLADGFSNISRHFL